MFLGKNKIRLVVGIMNLRGTASTHICGHDENELWGRKRAKFVRIMVTVTATAKMYWVFTMCQQHVHI
jgi:hypothetical protein